VDYVNATFTSIADDGILVFVKFISLRGALYWAAVGDGDESSASDVATKRCVRSLL
jgi:hypothetical protein